MGLSFYHRLIHDLDQRDVRSDEQSELYSALVALKQDIQNLFNAQPRIAQAAEYGLSDSILNYGLLNLKEFNLLSETDQAAFCYVVQQCLEWHEPRLAEVSVKLDLTEHFPAPDLNVSFKIYATFRLGTMSHPLLLQSSLNTIGGNIFIKDIQNIL